MAVSNLDEPQPLINKKETIIGVLVPFMVVQWICVALRFWTRTRLHSLGYDDAFVFIALIASTLGVIFICLATQNGLGEHFALLGHDDVVMFQKKYYISMLTYNIATTFTKLCLLAQYIRMFEAGSRLRRTSWIVFGVTVVWGTVFIMIAAVPCVPVSAFWDRGSGSCYGYGSIESPALQSVYTSHTTTNVVLDLIVLAIPAPLYFEKTTAWKTRIGIGCLLLLGVVANIMSIWRLQTLIQTKASTYPVVDPTWYGPRAIVLAAIEVNLATVCASVPIFWPLITEGLNKIFVTQEVHVVHQHRRLSGEEHLQRGYGSARAMGGSDLCSEEEDHYEMQASESGTLSRSHSRGGSESSLTLGSSKIGVLTKQEQQKRDGHIPPVHNRHQHNQHYSDKYVASRVAPLELGLHPHEQGHVTASNEIKSGGPKGFKKEQERFGNNRSRKRSDGSGSGVTGGPPYYEPPTQSKFED